MKRISFVMIAALTMLASCSKDEIVGHQDDLPIQFRTVIEKQTRATSYTTNTLTSFAATAYVGSTGSYAMENVEFSNGGSSTTYRVVGNTKYYWPKNVDVNFYAYAPKASATNGISYTNESEIEVTPLSDTDSQVDLIYAANVGNKAQDAMNGVTLNFRHAMSKILIRVKNSSSDIKFDVTGWKIAGVDGSALFEYDKTLDTNTPASGSKNTFDRTLWSGNDDIFTASYSKTFNAKSVTGVNTTWGTLDGSAILIPQYARKAHQYSGSDPANNPLDGAYIAIQYKAVDGSNTVIAPAGTWGCWPVRFDWQPGFRYIYTIDLAEMGYSETGKEQLEPVIDNLEIALKFVDVTVDAWQPEDDDDANNDISMTGGGSGKSFLRFHTEGGTQTFYVGAVMGGETVTNLEYSLDEGATWLEVLFAVENNNIIENGIEFGDINSNNVDLLLRGMGFYNDITDMNDPKMKQFGFASETQLVDCTGNIGVLTNYNNPPTVLTIPGQYYGLFAECNCLRAAPELPATTLTYGCYAAMFSECTNLISAPELPAESLPDMCYAMMFNECSSLNYVKALFVDYTGTPFVQWLNDVSSTGTFKKNPNATWTNNEVGIPDGWTVE